MIRTVGVTITFLALLGATAPAQQSAGLSPATRTKLMESLRRGAAFLHQQQRPDGRFDNHPGITAMAAEYGA